MEPIYTTLISPGPELFQFGPLTIRWYGVLIASAVLIGLNLSSFLAKKKKLPNNLISDLLPILVLSSVVGARAYYVGFEWNNYAGDNFWSVIRLLGLKIPIPTALEIWGGGIAIHGALIAGTISIFVFCRVKRLSFLTVLDVISPSVALGQAIGRWGNFFNNEAFGLPTELPWKLFIPYGYRPEILANQKFFHPTFLYESIWNLGVFLLLIFLFNKNVKTKSKNNSGFLSFIYIITYSLGRLWIEGLRIDPLCIASSQPFCEGGFRIAQIISVIFIIGGIVGLFWLSKSSKQSRTMKAIGDDE